MYIARYNETILGEYPDQESAQADLDQFLNVANNLHPEDVYGVYSINQANESAISF